MVTPVWLVWWGPVSQQWSLLRITSSRSADFCTLHRCNRKITHLAHPWGALWVMGTFCEATLGSSYPSTLSNLPFILECSGGLPFQTSWFESGNWDLLSLIPLNLSCVCVCVCVCVEGMILMSHSPVAGLQEETEIRDTPQRLILWLPLQL